MALLAARGEMAMGETLRARSIIGSEFVGRIVRATQVAGRPAIVPAISGRAWITGEERTVLDPADPFPAGYTLSDTWYRALD